MTSVSTEPVDTGRERMTFDEYCDWLDPETHAELVRGEVVMHSPVSLPHANASAFLLFLIQGHVSANGLGTVLCDPFQMRLGEDESRAPDIMFVASAHRDRLKNTYLDGPADLVVEIVSPSSVGRDRGEKYYAYEKAGVREYWIVDPERERAEFHVLNVHGIYDQLAVSPEGKLESVVLEGFWLNVSWLWQDPMPSALQCLKEIGAL